MSTILNAVMIVAVVWFVYQRLVPVKGIKNISTTALKQELTQKGKQFIDVRTPNEFKGNHIKGFHNIPLFDLPKRAQELSKEQEVVVICQSGMRSSKASKLLKKLGFNNITNVKGGMSAWR
ncbi:rhodanese-related sulfurtransferase [Paenibacillus sp. DS2015]|uniref:rhodanese-like domain-containing protein n=1 Tax=Paenibacillus sp. DS2015 TaxID=3373917 RepID=UPI003D2188FA